MGYRRFQIVGCIFVEYDLFFNDLSRLLQLQILKPVFLTKRIFENETALYYLRL